ncbi:MAG: hypothetical protein WCJ32_10580 [Actinomycetota bacterium]
MGQPPSAEADLHRRGRRTVLAACALLLPLTACSQFSTASLQLRRDATITITAPHDRTAADRPLHVEWTDVAPRNGGAYMVLIDRSPMPVGQDVGWFARDDKDCAASPGCPNARWLSLRGITVTADRFADIAIIPRKNANSRNKRYDVTVVRLDRDGRRDTEATFTVTVEIRAAR